jgi:hypothetical protein
VVIPYPLNDVSVPAVPYAVKKVGAIPPAPMESV